jgi:hypothetical protein
MHSSEVSQINKNKKKKIKRRVIFGLCVFTRKKRNKPTPGGLKEN